MFLCRLEELKQARIQDRETIERQNQQLSDYEAEINLLRRRIETMEIDRERDKKEIARLQEALNRARIVSSFIPFITNMLLNHPVPVVLESPAKESIDYLIGRQCIV